MRPQRKMSKSDKVAERALVLAHNDVRDDYLHPERTILRIP